MTTANEQHIYLFSRYISLEYLLYGICNAIAKLLMAIVISIVSFPLVSKWREIIEQYCNIVLHSSRMYCHHDNIVVAYYKKVTSMFVFVTT
jgi:hypothetical protein